MKMMKRIFILTIILIQLLSLSVLAKGQIKVYVNQVEVVSDTPAESVNQRTMLPFRVVLNALGVSNESIVWWENSQSIEVNSNGTFLFLVVGSQSAILNGSLITLDAAPYLSNGRTMVPVRFISEALSAQVAWEESSSSVFITK